MIQSRKALPREKMKKRTTTRNMIPGIVNNRYEYFPPIATVAKEDPYLSSRRWKPMCARFPRVVQRMEYCPVRTVHRKEKAAKVLETKEKAAKVLETKEKVAKVTQAEKMVVEMEVRSQLLSQPLRPQLQRFLSRHLGLVDRRMMERHLLHFLKNARKSHQVAVLFVETENVSEPLMLSLILETNLGLHVANWNYKGLMDWCRWSSVLLLQSYFRTFVAVKPLFRHRHHHPPHQRSHRSRLPF